MIILTIWQLVTKLIIVIQVTRRNTGFQHVDLYGEPDENLREVEDVAESAIHVELNAGRQLSRIDTVLCRPD